MKTASWIIKNKATGEVIREIYNEKLIALPKPEYVAVPIEDHLGEINLKIKLDDEKRRAENKTEGL